MMELFVFAGPNGSGKSTFINGFLKRHEGLPYICPDSYFSYLYPDLTPASEQYEEKYIDAMQQAAKLRADFITEKKSFSFETVLSQRDEILFIKRAKSCGYRINTFYMTTENPNINFSVWSSGLKMAGMMCPQIRLWHATTALWP